MITFHTKGRSTQYAYIAVKYTQCVYWVVGGNAKNIREDLMTAILTIIAMSVHAIFIFRREILFDKKKFRALVGSQSWTLSESST